MIEPTQATEPAQPAGQGLWDTLADNVEAAPPPTTNLWANLQDRLDFSRRKPCRAPGVEVVRQPSARGAEYYVLHNKQANTYLKLDGADYFLWQHLDGEHSVRDLAVAYFATYRTFSLERIVQLINQLTAKHLLVQKPLNVLDRVASHLQNHTLAYKLKRFADTSMQKEFPLKNIDALYSALYRRLAWRVFTRPFLLLAAVVAAVGLAFFVSLLLAGTYRLAEFGGSYGLGLLVVLVAGYVMIFLHESGHALAMKHYGRTIHRGGMLFYYGVPAFFIDTTDIWMAPKAARLKTSFAGPAADMLGSGLFALCAALLPAGPWNPLCYQLAAVGYLGVITNLAPVMELDGYFILMDWLEIPLLRKKSLAFVRQQLLPRLQKRKRFSREERIFSIYGVLTAAWTGFSIVLTVYLWPTQLRGLIDSALSGRDLLTTVLVGGLAVIAAVPMILGLAIWAVFLAGNAARRVRVAIRH